MKLDINAGHEALRDAFSYTTQNMPYLKLHMDISIEELEHFRKHDKETYLRIGHILQMAGSEAAKGVQV